MHERSRALLLMSMKGLSHVSDLHIYLGCCGLMPACHAGVVDKAVCPGNAKTPSLRCSHSLGPLKGDKVRGTAARMHLMLPSCQAGTIDFQRNAHRCRDMTSLDLFKGTLGYNLDFKEASGDSRLMPMLLC